jgi:glycosyltransferase involved in cell wall biosynthesis
MKILHCIPGMGGGGAERQLAYLAGPLAASGWDVHVALATGGPNLVRLEAGGASIHWLNGIGNHDPRLIWQLARIFRRLRPDVVQVWFVQMEVLAGAVSELLGVPWVISERSSLLAYPPSVKNRMRVALAATADAIIANSSAGAAYWDNRAKGSVRRFVIPNALPLDEIDDASAAVPLNLPVGRDAAVVLFVGRFGVEKNVNRIFRCLCEVVRRPRTVAILCGDGPLRPDVQRAIAAANLDDRIFAPGYVQDIWPLMKRADVMVATGLFEGRPNSVLEAMACSLPLVVSDIPAHREILDEHSACFVDPIDDSALTNAVLTVLDHSTDARQRAAVARRKASAWSVPAVAEQYDRVYRDVIKQRATFVQS